MAKYVLIKVIKTDENIKNEEIIKNSWGYFNKFKDENFSSRYTIRLINKEIDIIDANKLKAKYLVINGFLIKLFFAPTSCIVFIISLFE